METAQQVAGVYCGVEACAVCAASVGIEGPWAGVAAVALLTGALRVWDRVSAWWAARREAAAASGGGAGV